MIKLILIFIFPISLFAQFYPNSADKQLIYNDFIYESQIRTVQFYKEQLEMSYPILMLGETNEILNLEFDELGNETSNFWYTFVQCDANWEPSTLLYSELYDGMSSFNITDYTASQYARVSYMHYYTVIQNKFKFSGNYLLKVYRDQDEEQLVITRRFIVVKPTVNISLENNFSSGNISMRQAIQTLNFSLNPAQVNVTNPSRDLTIKVIQNGRWDTAKELKPFMIRPENVEYSFMAANDFDGGNEFRKLDLRSVFVKSNQIQGTDKLDKHNCVWLYPESPRSKYQYLKEYDFNGSFTIINREYKDYDIESDYNEVIFRLKTTEQKGSVYVFGKFSDWKPLPSCEMKYDNGEGVYVGKLWLKQGVYDYEYVLEDKNKVNEKFFEGSYYETENYYTILVYYKNPVDRTHQIVGMLNLGYNQ